MKKRTIVTACFLLATGAAFAQTEPQAAVTDSVAQSTSESCTKTYRFGDGWFVSAAGGGQVYFGDHDGELSLGSRIAPALDIAVGKWFSPAIGVRLMYSGLSMKGATQRGALAHSTGEEVPGKGGEDFELEKQKFGYLNIHADALFNLSNIIWGYNGHRFYNLTVYGGVGVAHVADDPTATSLSGDIGLLHSFRICSALDLHVDLRGSLVNDSFDGEKGGRSGEGIFTATIGLTYKFGKH